MFDFDPVTATMTSATLRCRGLNWVVRQDWIANKTIFASPTTFVTAIVTLANETSIRETSSSKGWSYRADSNGRS